MWGEKRFEVRSFEDSSKRWWVAGNSRGVAKEAFGTKDLSGRIRRDDRIDRFTWRTVQPDLQQQNVG